MSITLKLTTTILDELAKRDSEFVARLSHAATKEIGERYSSALLQSQVVQDALEKLDQAIHNARVDAGRQLEAKIGEWDNRYGGGYTLRANVVSYIEENFHGIVHAWFKKWIESGDISKKFDELARQYVESRIREIMKEEIGKFLKR